MQLPIVLSVIAVSLSSAALGWQVLAFLLSGARVKAELSFGVTHPNGREVAAPAGRWAKLRAEKLLEAGDPLGNREFAEIRAVNVGRGKAQVRNVDLVIDRAMYFVKTPEVQNPELPLALDGWSSETWRIDLRKLELGGALDRATTHVLRAQVTLGNGRKTRSGKFKMPKNPQ